MNDHYFSMVRFFVSFVLSVFLCATAYAAKGMTWGVARHIESFGIDLVSCHGSPGLKNGSKTQSCDAYRGDTSCELSRPILCINKKSAPRPSYEIDGEDHAMPAAYYRGWSGGNIEITAPVKGTALTSLAAADAICAEAFGQGYQMAEFHDGKVIPENDQARLSAGDVQPECKPARGGWSWYGFGNIRPASRFWVYIDDQRANCWNSANGLADDTREPQVLSNDPDDASTTKKGIAAKKCINAQAVNGRPGIVRPRNKGYVYSSANKKKVPEHQETQVEVVETDPGIYDPNLSPIDSIPGVVVPVYR